MKLTPKSGLSLHRVLLQTVMRAPQSFFDETDSGITLNRFSQDMSLVDGQLPASAVMTVSCECYFSLLSGFETDILRHNAMPCFNWVDSIRV